MAELSDRIVTEAGASAATEPQRIALALGVRTLLPIVPATLLYLVGWIPFWGGFVFFVLAELIRWGGAVGYITLKRPPKLVQPLIEAAAVAVAPLFALAILVAMPASIQDRNVQMELVSAFMLWLCYLPYAVVSPLVLRLLGARI
jgi:hypothetical protein